MPYYHPNYGAQSYIHAIIVFLIGTSCALLQVKYQTEDVTPFETHYWEMLAFFVTTHVHAIVLVAEIKLRTSGSIYHEIFSKMGLFTGALTSILLLMILVPPVGWFNLVLWAICFLKVARHSYREFFRLLCSATVRIIELLKITLMKRRSFEQQYRLPV